MPWIECKNLASSILARATRQIAADWQLQYGYRPLLLETFVEQERFRGTAYQAANWICLGQTTGRGKLDVHHQALLPIKAVWVYPLDRHFRRVLCGWVCRSEANPEPCSRPGFLRSYLLSACSMSRARRMPENCQHADAGKKLR